VVKNTCTLFFKARDEVKVGSGVFLDEKTFGVGRFGLALPIFEIFGGEIWGGGIF
jgi:hypothetical protein